MENNSFHHQAMCITMQMWTVQKFGFPNLTHMMFEYLSNFKENFNHHTGSFCFRHLELFFFPLLLTLLY